MPRELPPICRILAGAWRAEPDPLEVPERALAASLPLLESTGAAGLAWQRAARTPELAQSVAAGRLRDCARMQALDGARHERALAELTRLFARGGAAPLLFKGWAVARHYGRPHLRPMGDVDLCAPPGRFDDLAALLREHGFRPFTSVAKAPSARAASFLSRADFPGKPLMVDLHERLEGDFLPGPEAAFARAVPVPLGGHTLLAPAAEDHLRLVAIHFLRHGGWRPLWLCDVAAMLETLPAGFDWDLCLGPEPWRRGWIASTLGLAHELLGARSDGIPRRDRVDELPGWLRSTVLREWQKSFSSHRPRPMFGYVWRRRRSRLAAEILARWPNAIVSTVELDRAFGRRHPWPYQLAHFSRTAGSFFLRGFVPR